MNSFEKVITSSKLKLMGLKLVFWSFIMLQTWGESNISLLPMNYKVESYMILLKKWGTNAIQLSQAQKQLSLWNFLNQDKNKNMSILNPNCETKKNKDKNTINAKQELNRILLQYWNKNKKRLWKETYPKLVLNKLKVMRNSTFVYTYWAHSSRKFIF